MIEFLLLNLLGLAVLYVSIRTLTIASHLIVHALEDPVVSFRYVFIRIVLLLAFVFAPIQLLILFAIRFVIIRTLRAINAFSKQIANAV